ncbi:unnamed protein product [Candidula unifasciata]|uniref:Testis-expressed sequence 264 protein n=1 Tax=Candidula unifasciata TaxID=100452 RepID=A0A8S3Z1V9_9EUPU|nr:unnamed protein product [Candidula unifasciata]
MFEGIGTSALLIYVSLLVIVLIALTLIILLIHSGLFRPVDDVGTGKPPIGQATIAYKFQKGSYSSAGQIFTEAALIAPDNKALGIYYDDPDKVDSNETRYLVGSVLSEGPTAPNEELVKKFIDQDYKILHLPEVTYAVQTKFPHITTLSILIAVHKAYPRLKDYIEEHKLCAHPFIEIYDGKTIHFVAPLSKQDEFYVPECEQPKCGDQDLSDGDGTVLDTSASALGESQESQNVSHTTDDSLSQDMPEPEPEEELQDKSAPIDVDYAEDVEDSNGNNNLVEGNGEERANDDEQASDDSSSSFEVLRTETAE